MAEIDIYITGLSSANSHLVSPDASRVTRPVEDIETFDPSRPSLCPSDSILLPISKIPGCLEVALKALTQHTEARTSFITYASSFLCSSYLINLTGQIPLFFLSRTFPKFIFLQFIPVTPLKETNGNSFKHFLGTGLFRRGWSRRYWLPILLKHEYVALRFIAQASYETAAQLRISPAPDVVTRIFMLFRGIRSDNLGFWAPAAAHATAGDGTTFWTKVVGVDAMRVSDHTLFRVLEWGGMEVE